MNHNIVFTSLAQNQTEYFIGVAKSLRSLGIRASILSFHEPSYHLIADAGLNGYNVFDVSRSLGEIALIGAEESFVKAVRDYEIEKPGLLLSHEKVSFRVHDTRRLQTKFCRYLAAVDECITRVERQGGPLTAIVQETGGFLSLIATYVVARKRKIDHFFAEPAFYRGRLFFTKNSLEAPKIRPRLADVLSEETALYLESTKRSGQIVVPRKDAWQYQGALKKIATPRNVRRLGEKLFQKFIRKQEEEFSHIGNYVGRHMRMLTAPIKLRTSFSSIPDRPFVYFPFHVPMDVALTVRAPAFLDQISLVDYLARSVPPTHVVAVKEHPALVGAIPTEDLKGLLRRNDNVVLLNPTLNNFEVMKRADTVVTVNSKSGAESLLCGTNVIVLGDAFYSEFEGLRYLYDVRELHSELAEAVEAPFAAKGLDSFFAAAWNQSLPGELYLNEQNNYSVCADSLSRLLSDPSNFCRGKEH